VGRFHAELQSELRILNLYPCVAERFRKGAYIFYYVGLDYPPTYLVHQSEGSSKFMGY